MRTIAHLSDLHFGRIEQGTLEPLRRRLRELAPDLVVISGDLTQRAKSAQFREARMFLDSLPGPQLLVPGNHDIPLYDVFRRFLRPLGRYRRIIARNVEPGFFDAEIAVVGINTARALSFKEGSVSRGQAQRVRRDLDAGSAQATRIVVAHHSDGTLQALEGCRVDVLLSGHGHVTRVVAGPALSIQAGTATSHRTRDESNAFNVLRVHPQRIGVDHYRLHRDNFIRAGSDAFARNGNGWRRDAAG